jgi:hypothetical protein
MHPHLDSCRLALRNGLRNQLLNGLWRRHNSRAQVAGHLAAAAGKQVQDSMLRRIVAAAAAAAAAVGASKHAIANLQLPELTAK